MSVLPEVPVPDSDELDPAYLASLLDGVETPDVLNVPRDGSNTQVQVMEVLGSQGSQE